MKKFIFYLLCGISIKLIAYLFGLIKNPPSWLIPDVQARMIVMGACICVAIAFWYVVLGMGKKAVIVPETEIITKDNYVEELEEKLKKHKVETERDILI